MHVLYPQTLIHTQLEEAESGHIIKFSSEKHVAPPLDPLQRIQQTWGSIFGDDDFISKDNNEYLIYRYLTKINII